MDSFSLDDVFPDKKSIPLSKSFKSGNGDTGKKKVKNDTVPLDDIMDMPFLKEKPIETSTTTIGTLSSTGNKSSVQEKKKNLRTLSEFKNIEKKVNSKKSTKSTKPTSLPETKREKQQEDQGFFFDPLSIGEGNNIFGEGRKRLVLKRLEDPLKQILSNPFDSRIECLPNNLLDNPFDNVYNNLLDSLHNSLFKRTFRQPIQPIVRTSSVRKTKSLDNYCNSEEMYHLTNLFLGCLEDSIPNDREKIWFLECLSERIPSLPYSSEVGRAMVEFVDFKTRQTSQPF